MAKFIIGIRNDLEEILKEFGQEPELYEVFGPPPIEIIPSGRLNCLPPRSLEELERQIDLAHKYGKRFMVTANSLCQHGEEFEPELEKKMLILFNFLADVRADNISIANSSILRWAKTYREKYHREHGRTPFGLISSTFRDITTTYQAENDVKEFGIEIIQPHQCLNRDFRILRELKELRDGVNFEVVLYASTGSTWLCSDKQAHRCAISHPEKTLGKLDYYKEHCITERQRNPFLIYIAPTIPPESIELYESLGYDRFKLAGRDMPTAWRMKNLRRYLDRKTEPGLGIADLCDTNLGREMPYISTEVVRDLIGELEKISHQPDFNFMSDYLGFCKQRYGESK